MPVPSPSDSIPFPEIRLTRAQRLISLAEFVLGSAIVLGHNVYHVVPNEVPILFVIGLISLRLPYGRWAVMALCWPIACTLTVLIPTAAAAVRLLLVGYVV